MTNSEFSFNLVYDGEDLESGSIDARDLAPALLAFADLVDQSGRVIVPEIPRLTVRVQTDFKEGCFDVSLELATAYDKFVTLFSGNHVQAWSTLLGVLGLSGAGVWQLLKKAKGRKPRVLEIERSEKVRITFDGKEVEDVPADVWALFNHLPTRRAIERVVEPITKDGIDELEIRKKGKPVINVAKGEAHYFKAPAENEDEQIFDNPNAILIVHSPSFREHNKWRVFDGTRSIWVAVEDKAFIAKINSGTEAFRKGDILHVTLRTRQWIEAKALKAEYSILEVHSHDNRLDHPGLPGTENA